MNETNCEDNSQVCGQIMGQGLSSRLGDAMCEMRRPERPTMRATVEVPADRGFDEAHRAVMQGSKIARRGWNGPGQFVACEWPDKGAKFSKPFLYLKNAQNEFVPWLPSQGDLFARDWAILP